MACRDCFRGGIAVGEPKGTITTIHGVETYVAGTPETTTSSSTIIYFTDAFGISLVNNKLLADSYALATGFRVLVPNIIPGGPMSVDFMNLTDKVVVPVGLFDIRGQMTRIYQIWQILLIGLPFLWRAYPSYPSCFNACLAYTRKVKAELPSDAKLGLAGFCWGGYQSINLCAQPAVPGGSERLVDAQFTAHPSGLKVPNQIIDAVLKFQTPVALAQAQDDFAISTDSVLEAEAVLRGEVGEGEGEGGYNYQITYYSGVPHGFAVRARPENARDSEASDQAKEQAIAWFKKWL